MNPEPDDDVKTEIAAFPPPSQAPIHHPHPHSTSSHNANASAPTTPATRPAVPTINPAPPFSTVAEGALPVAVALYWLIGTA